MKGIIYYTDSRLSDLGHGLKLAEAVRATIAASGLSIVSCSLKPLDFGYNIVLDLEPCVLSMYIQILTALEASDTKYVFFCEHDVLYHPSHFEFYPSTDDTFYYNTNVWRCHVNSNKCTTYDQLRSVSGMCVNRELAIEHYRKRIAYIRRKGFDRLPISRNPRWARIMGYEPGKSPHSGGFSKDKMADWRSDFPNVDVRHRLAMTPCKMSLDQFAHQPSGWKECTLKEIPGWDLAPILI